MVEQYVSMSCLAGDITLTLEPDSTFDMVIALWDERAQAHNGQESVSGKWSKENKFLKLITSDKNELLYERTSTAMGIGANEVEVLTYGFRSSKEDFFGTGFDLLERGKTDDFSEESD